MWWSNAQRKAQFPTAYHCSISSSLLPEIDEVTGWTKAREWKAINCFFAEEGDITIRPCQLAGTTSWAELHLLLWQATGEGWGGCGGLRGVFGTGLASIVALAMFHSHSLCPMPFPFPLLFIKLLSRFVLLCSSEPLSASSYSDFLLTGILSAIFQWHWHPLYHTPSLSLFCQSFLHCPSVLPGDVDRGWEVAQHMISFLLLLPKTRYFTRAPLKWLYT